MCKILKNPVPKSQEKISGLDLSFIRVFLSLAELGTDALLAQVKAGMLMPEISLCPVTASPHEPRAEGLFQGGGSVSEQQREINKLFDISSEGFGFLNYIFSENTNN